MTPKEAIALIDRAAAAQLDLVRPRVSDADAANAAEPPTRPILAVPDQNDSKPQPGASKP